MANSLKLLAYVFCDDGAKEAGVKQPRDRAGTTVACTINSVAADWNKTITMRADNLAVRICPCACYFPYLVASSLLPDRTRYRDAGSGFCCPCFCWSSAHLLSYLLFPCLVLPGASMPMHVPSQKHRSLRLPSLHAPEQLLLYALFCWRVEPDSKTLARRWSASNRGVRRERGRAHRLPTWRYTASKDRDWVGGQGQKETLSFGMQDAIKQKGEEG